MEAIPRDRRKVYKMRPIIEALVDRGSFFEIGRMFGRSIITGLARLDGLPVAVMAGGNGGLIALPDAFNTANGATTVALAAKYRVPAIFYDRRFPADGGLMSYAADQEFQYRDSATYVDRILRGAKPSDLPVQFATKFELVINLKTANALGLTVSQNLLSIADEVIE